MLELEEFKKLLLPNYDLDDEQIEKLRRQMHQLAEIVIDAALRPEEARGSGSVGTRPRARTSRAAGVLG